MSNILPRSIAPALNSALLAPPMLSVLRIVAGLAFLEHGTGKLLGFPPACHSSTRCRLACCTSPERWSSLAARSSYLACSHARRRSFCPASWPPPISWRTSRSASSGAQLRRASGALLLHLPLSRRGRPGAVGARQELTGSVGRCGE